MPRFSPQLDFPCPFPEVCVARKKVGMEEQGQLAGGIGNLLRRARERRRSNLEDASRDTCISVTYLSALERGAPLGEFPAPVYARGFLREYARYLGLDPGPLVERFWAGEEVPDPVTQMSYDASLHAGERQRRMSPGLKLRSR
jgi:cytoskeletal protein RodZ